MSTIASKVSSPYPRFPRTRASRRPGEPLDAFCTILLDTLANSWHRTFTSSSVCLIVVAYYHSSLTNSAGNDPELDPDRPADPPTKAIDKPVQRTGKREGGDAPRPAPERSANQSRPKQSDNGNDNGMCLSRRCKLRLCSRRIVKHKLMNHSVPGSRCRSKPEPRQGFRWYVPHHQIVLSHTDVHQNLPPQEVVVANADVVVVDAEVVEVLVSMTVIARQASRKCRNRRLH